MERPSVRLNTKIETENAMVVACFQYWNGFKRSCSFLIDHLDLEFVGAVVDPRLPVITLIQEGEPLPVIL